MTPHRRLSLALGLTALAGAALAATPRPGGHPRFLADAAGPPDFANCYACHDDNETNTGDGAVELAGVPVEYQPGQTYRFTVALQDPDSSIWAFELVATDGAGAQQGSFTIVDPRTELGVSGGRQYPRSGQDAAGTFAGTPDGPVSWQVDWTAPAAGRGTAFFYMAALAGDQSGDDRGDFTYTLGEMAAEGGAAHPPAALLMHPDDPDLSAGEPLIVRARAKDLTGASQTVYFAARVRLPNGNFFPAAGWLAPPLPLRLAPGELKTVVMQHAVPVALPGLTVAYQGLLGTASGAVVDEASIPVHVLR